MRRRIPRATPTSEEQLADLRKLEDSGAAGLEFWTSPAHLSESVAIAVEPDVAPILVEFLNKRSIGHETKVDNLQSLIDEEMAALLAEDDADWITSRDVSKSNYNLASYNRLRQINMRMREMAKSHPTLMTVSSIGTTYEGRSIDMAKLSLQDGKTRKSVWLDCGIHAREWVSPAFCMFTIGKLLEQGANGPLASFNFYMVPVANPDGYEYTWNTNRMWRKNRRPSGSVFAKAGAPDATVEAESPVVQVEAVGVLAREAIDVKEDAKEQVAVKANVLSDEESNNSLESTEQEDDSSASVSLKQFWPGSFYPQQQQPLYPQYPQLGSPGVGAGYPASQGAGYPTTQGTGYPPSQGSGFPQAGQGAGNVGSGNPKCSGVDPNRNFPAKWAEVGSSNSICQDTFHGPQPFSEAESIAIRDAVRAIMASGSPLVSFVSVHAYSQFWMSPYGFKKGKSPDHADHERVMGQAVRALQSKYGTQFKYGPINKVIYQASGSSVDWAYDNEGIKYSFALELRDTGRYGFLLPADQITPTNEETWAGLVAMVNAIKAEYPVSG